MDRPVLEKGTYFYRANSKGVIDLVRLERIKNEDCFIVTRDKKYDEKIKLTKEEFSKYVKLKPHGYITCCTVTLDSGFRDVIVTMHREEDIENGSAQPYAVCRQSVLDIFTNLTKQNEDHNIYIGLSITQDSCPPDISFQMMLAANNVSFSMTIAIYLDDTLDDIMHFIPTYRYDEVLSSVMPQFDLINNDMKVYGRCSTLRELFEYTDFIRDVKYGFGCRIIDTKVTTTEEGYVDALSIEAIQNELGFVLFDPIGIEYWYDVELDKIDNDYVIITDSNNNTYVVSYVKGENIDPATRTELLKKMQYIASLKMARQ